MGEERSIDDPRITSYSRLVEVHAALWSLLDRDLESAVGVPLLWYAVLLHIGRSPGGVRPISELVEATAFTSGGVTRLVDRIERAGYVARSPCPSDRRVVYVGLTEAGHDLLERGTAAHLRGIQSHLIDALVPEEVAQLDAILAKLLISLAGAR